jgi:hypothetical protein
MRLRVKASARIVAASGWGGCPLGPWLERSHANRVHPDFDK